MSAIPMSELKFISQKLSECLANVTTAIHHMEQQQQQHHGQNTGKETGKAKLYLTTSRWYYHNTKFEYLLHWPH